MRHQIHNINTNPNPTSSEISMAREVHVSFAANGLIITCRRGPGCVYMKCDKTYKGRGKNSTWVYYSAFLTHLAIRERENKQNSKGREKRRYPLLVITPLPANAQDPEVETKWQIHEKCQ